MSLVNKTFIKTLLITMIMIACGSGYSAATAASSLFTVENVQVDVTAANALEARQQAFEEAQFLAFEELTKRMLSAPQPADYRNLPVQTISSLVQDYEVKDEKLSAKRYIGTYTFRFRDNAVRKYFSGKNHFWPALEEQFHCIWEFHSLSSLSSLKLSSDCASAMSENRRSS